MEKHKGMKSQMRFPEAEFRLEFGKSGAHASWEDVYEWIVFTVEEIAPNQLLPRDWNKWSEFSYKRTKQYGWFQFTQGKDEFLPESK